MMLEMTSNKLICFYKSGVLKATGPHVSELMEGEWAFYRESGKLWAVGNFRNA